MLLCMHLYYVIKYSDHSSLCFNINPIPHEQSSGNVDRDRQCHAKAHAIHSLSVTSHITVHYLLGSQYYSQHLNST